MNKIEENIKEKVSLLEHQVKFVNSKSKFPAIIGGFSCGKTDSLAYRALSLIFKYGPMFKKETKGRYIIGVYEPTYDLVVIN